MAENSAERELALSGGEGTSLTWSQAGYVPIPLRHVPSGALRGIDIYLRYESTADFVADQAGYALYRSANLPFTERDRARLLEDENRFVYIRIADHVRFREQVESVIVETAGDPHKATSEKVAIIYETSVELINDLLSAPDPNAHAQRLHEVSRAVATVVLSDADAFAHLFAASHHDFYTGTHMVNVGTWLVPLAYAMGVRDLEDLSHVCQAGMLHDVGKIFVPAEILNKPDRLSDEDWVQIKRHPDMGGAHLKAFDAVNPLVTDVCRQHHERMDGSGYPGRLRHLAIHPVSRMCAVVDSFDAMTAMRPFKKRTLSVAEAVAELKSQSPVKYDRKVVEAWVGLVSGAKLETVADENPPSGPPSAFEGPRPVRLPRQYAARLQVLLRQPDGSYVDGPGVRVTVHSISKGDIGLLSVAALEVGQRVRIRLKTGGPREKILHGQTIRCRAYGDGYHEIGVELFPPYPSAGTG